MPTTLHENRPSARIGVVKVQKPMVFLRFLKFPRDLLRGSAWSRCKNPLFFAISAALARSSAGIGVVEVQKPGSAWSSRKNPRFFAISAALAQPCGNRRGQGKTRGFLRLFLLFELVLGSCANRPLESLARTGRQTLTTTRPHSHRGAWSTSCRAQSSLLSPSGGYAALSRVTRSAKPRSGIWRTKEASGRTRSKKWPSL